MLEASGLALGVHWVVEMEEIPWRIHAHPRGGHAHGETDCPDQLRPGPGHEVAGKEDQYKEELFSVCDRSPQEEDQSEREDA